MKYPYFKRHIVRIEFASFSGKRPQDYVLELSENDMQEFTDTMKDDEEVFPKTVELDANDSFTMFLSNGPLVIKKQKEIETWKLRRKWSPIEPEDYMMFRGQKMN